MVSVFLCVMPFADTLGMWPCDRCGQLTYTEHGPDCDFTDEEIEEIAEERRNENRPDADWDEVAAMLDDPGVVEYRDPFELYEGWVDTPEWPEVL